MPTTKIKSMVSVKSGARMVLKRLVSRSNPTQKFNSFRSHQTVKQSNPPKMRHAECDGQFGTINGRRAKQMKEKHILGFEFIAGTINIVMWATIITWGTW